MALFVTVMVWWSYVICLAFLVLVNMILIGDLGVAYVS
jgi:hypothetical protein